MVGLAVLNEKLKALADKFDVAVIVETYLWITLLIVAVVTVAAGLYIVKLRGASPPAVT